MCYSVGMASLRKLRCRHHTLFSNQCPRLVKKCHVSLQFDLRGWITIPGVPSKEKWNSTGWFCPPRPPLYRGRDAEKRRAEERRSEKRKSEKKEDAGARKGRTVAIHCVFPMICGSGGSEVASLKRRVRRHLAR